MPTDKTSGIKLFVFFIWALLVFHDHSGAAVKLVGYDDQGSWLVTGRLLGAWRHILSSLDLSSLRIKTISAGSSSHKWSILFLKAGA